MDCIQFLSVEDVLFIQQDTIAQEGGLSGLRDRGLLESAVLMPQQQFGGSYLHEDLAAMAAAYIFHIASNHPFLDGNKRAAAMSALVFLDNNAATRLPEPEELERVTLAVAASALGKDELTAWMRKTIGSTA